MTRECGASFSFVWADGESRDTFRYERQLAAQGFTTVAGVDEAGRGPLAGPVVAGCAILSEESGYTRFQDSKKLTPARRDRLFEILHDSGTPVGVGIVSAEEIDNLNILQASLLAMKRAVHDCAARFACSPSFLLVDGKFTVPMSLPQQPLIKGESKSASIAAASIIAKVTRDRMMEEYHEMYPQYDLARNKGYPTRAHREAIGRHGPSPLHRRTFKGVREYCQEFAAATAKKQIRLW